MPRHKAISFPAICDPITGITAPSYQVRVELTPDEEIERDVDEAASIAREAAQVAAQAVLDASRASALAKLKDVAGLTDAEIAALG